MVEDRGRVRVDGAELYFEVAGEGQPLVLLHDGLLDRRVWDDQFATFAPLPDHPLRPARVRQVVRA